MISRKIKSAKDTISEVLDIFKVISSNSQIELISQEELASIKNLFNELGYYNSMIPRVFLMGEFKAGKSSLVNSLLGKNYAPTDILEMTSWVSKFWQSENEYCKIKYTDDTEEYTATSDFISKCENRKYDSKYLKRIKIVEFGIKGISEKYILIDTPGFGSITTDNERKMVELSYEADIILFVIDVESIGSIKEAAILKEYIKNEIPYLIVISKTDLIESTKELDEIKKFIIKSYQADENRIIPFSTHNTSNTNVFDLKLKLEEFAATFNSLKRQEAELGFLKIIARRITDLLTSLENKVIDIQKRVNSFNLYIDSISGTISKSLQIQIEEFASKSLLQNKREEIIGQIGAILSNSDGNISESQITDILNKTLGPDFLDFTNKNIIIEIPPKMKEQWVSYLDEIKEKSIDIFGDLKKNILNNDSQIISISTVGNYDIQLDQITTKALSRGIKGSLGFAGALTAYAAWFGPAAATVSLPMALSGVGIPILVVGGAISGLLAYKKRNETRDRINLFASDITNNVVSKIVQDVIMPVISKQIIDLNKSFAQRIKDEFYNENMLGLGGTINLNKIKILKTELSNF